MGRPRVKNGDLHRLEYVAALIGPRDLPAQSSSGLIPSEMGLAQVTLQIIRGVAIIFGESEFAICSGVDLKLEIAAGELIGVEDWRGEGEDGAGADEGG